MGGEWYYELSENIPRLMHDTSLCQINLIMTKDKHGFIPNTLTYRSDQAPPT